MKNILIFIYLLLIQHTFADEALPRYPKVCAAPIFGSIYAKTVASDLYTEGNTGETKVYSVGLEKDSLLNTYPFYIWQPLIAISPENGYTLIRCGEWPQHGDNPIIVGFYRNGNAIKEYYANDFIKWGAQKKETVAHFSVLEKIPELVKTHSVYYQLKVTLNGGKEIFFDLSNGHCIKKK